LYRIVLLYRIVDHIVVNRIAFYNEPLQV
jgi:hypothetical protein